MIKSIAIIAGGAGFLALSINLFYYGLTEPVAYALWRDKTVAVTGVVVRHHVVREGGSVARYPVIEFVGPEEKRFTFTSRLRSTDVERYGIGRAIPVRYSAVDPSNAAIDTAFRRWGPMALFVGLGVASLGVSAFMFIAGFVLLSRSARAVSGVPERENTESE